MQAYILGASHVYQTAETRVGIFVSQSNDYIVHSTDKHVSKYIFQIKCSAKDFKYDSDRRLATA